MKDKAVSSNPLLCEYRHRTTQQKRNQPLTRLTYHLIGLLLLSLSFSLVAKTTINSQSAKNKLLGKHTLSLQWLDEKSVGSVTITEKNGQLHIKGKHKSGSKEGVNDYLTIEGIVTKINKRNFIFKGKIVTKVYHIAGGKACVREGIMTFRISGKRKYWRLKENLNPCSSVTDYVNIFF